MSLPRQVHCGFCPECAYPGPHQTLPAIRHGGHWAECGNYHQIKLTNRRWAVCGHTWQHADHPARPIDPIHARIATLIGLPDTSAGYPIDVVDSPVGTFLHSDTVAGIAQLLTDDAELRDLLLVTAQHTVGAA